MKLQIWTRAQWAWTAQYTQPSNTFSTSVAAAQKKQDETHYYVDTHTHNKRVNQNFYAPKNKEKEEATKSSNNDNNIH